ncbi:centrosomal protein of 164 kDa-like isoform X1 [Anguilla rostrata]|uniref:centrosomal protein of 164 kDa-like isoform X1 n=1 Tax=Anguilla rostrata TaxID=7938 RepID=UPI0030D2576A
MSAAALQIGDQLILEEDYDENYIPSEQEILEYAREIGIDPEREPELMWLAREGIVAPLPAEWKPCQDVTGDVYYFNFSSGQSTWDHPCDEQYRRLVVQERERAQAHGGPAKKEKKKKKEKKEKKVKKGKEVIKAPAPLSSALGPLTAPLGSLAPLRGLSSAPIPSLRGSAGSSGGLEPLKTPLGVSDISARADTRPKPAAASLSTLSSSLLGGRQEERVSLSLPGFEDDEEKVSENEFSRGTGRLLQNLHLDLDALGGGLQYEDSEASVSGPAEEKTDPELQDLALSPEHSPDPHSQDSVNGRHLHSSPLGGSRGGSSAAACPPTPGQQPPSLSEREGDEEEGKDDEEGTATLEEVLDEAGTGSRREEEETGAQSEREGKSVKAGGGKESGRAVERSTEMADEREAEESEEEVEEEANEEPHRRALTDEEGGEESEEVVEECVKSEGDEGRGEGEDVSEDVERSLRSKEALEQRVRSNQEGEAGGASESREGEQGGAGDSEEEEEDRLEKKEGSEQEEEQEEGDWSESSEGPMAKERAPTPDPRPAEGSEASEHIEAASSSTDDPKAGFRSKLLENVLNLEDLSPAEPEPPLNKVSDKAQREAKEKEEEEKRRKRAEAAERRLQRVVREEPANRKLSQSDESQASSCSESRPQAEPPEAERMLRSREEAPGVDGRGRAGAALERRQLREETEREVVEERGRALRDRGERLQRLREELSKEEREQEQRLKEENEERLRTLRRRLQTERQEEESRLRQEAELRLQELQESELREREKQERKLREEGAARLRALQEALEAEWKEEKEKLEERRKQEVERLRQDAEKDLRAEKVQLQKEREEQLGSVRAERRSSQSRLEVRSPRQEQRVAEYQRELGDMLQEVREEVQREHNRKLEQLREEHRSELESIREKHLEEERLQRERLLGELQEERSRLRTSHSSQLEELRSQLDSRLQETHRTHTQKENELQESEQQLELRAKELKTQNARLQAQAEDVRKRREQLRGEEGEVERGLKSLPRILEERDALREEVERAREEGRRLKERNGHLENKVELLQARCEQLSHRVSDIELVERQRQASPRQQGDEGRGREREGKRKEKEAPTAPPAGQEEALHLEDLEPPQAASTPPLSRDSENSLDDVRQYLSSEGVSLQKARRFLERQSGSLSERQAALRAARTSWAQDPSRDTITQDLFRNLQQEASHLEQLRATVQRGQTLLRRKEERLNQLETSLQEELSDDDGIRETAGRRVTFEGSESELSSIDALDGAGPLPTVPAKVQQLADSLQHISGQLNSVLGALGTLAHRQGPALPPYGPLSFPLSRPPAPGPAPSSAWAPPSSGSLSRGLGDALGGRWARLFPAGAVDTNGFPSTGSHSAYSAYTPASLCSKQPVSAEVDGQCLQARIEETKRWLESRRKESSVPLLTRYRNPPSLSGLVQLSLDENNQIKVYHY